MKVKTLIKKLEKVNPEAECRLNDFQGDEVLFVNARKGCNSIVWLDGEHDFDLGAEISARYERAIEEQIDELDFYMDLLEIGIGVNLVRKYMGSKKANHMQKFCEEHGLL